jgi:hypothetical protein
MTTCPTLFFIKPYNMKDTVECRSESSYPEKPVAFIWEGIRHDVEAILSRSRNPRGISFRVRTTDGLVFELEYGNATDAWLITPIQED